MSDEQIREAIQSAFAEAAELQKLAVKPMLTPSEVNRLYGIAESTLEKMRAANRGPAYSQLTAKGKVLYSRKAIDSWLEVQSITPRAV